MRRPASKARSGKAETGALLTHHGHQNGRLGRPLEHPRGRAGRARGPYRAMAPLPGTPAGATPPRKGVPPPRGAAQRRCPAGGHSRAAAARRRAGAAGVKTPPPWRAARRGGSTDVPGRDEAAAQVGGSPPGTLVEHSRRGPGQGPFSGAHRAVGRPGGGRSGPGGPTKATHSSMGLPGRYRRGTGAQFAKLSESEGEMCRSDFF
jgi:hypothetical protein